MNRNIHENECLHIQYTVISEKHGNFLNNWMIILLIHARKFPSKVLIHTKNCYARVGLYNEVTARLHQRFCSKAAMQHARVALMEYVFRTNAFHGDCCKSRGTSLRTKDKKNLQTLRITQHTFHYLCTLCYSTDYTTHVSLSLYPVFVHIGF